MARHLARLALTAAFAGVALTATGGTAHAGCAGTDKTVVACWQMVPVYSDCVYTGGDQCLQVDGAAPLCLYGTILGGPYATVWC